MQRLVLTICTYVDYMCFESRRFVGRRPGLDNRRARADIALWVPRPSRPTALASIIPGPRDGGIESSLIGVSCVVVKDVGC